MEKLKLGPQDWMGSTFRYLTMVMEYTARVMEYTAKVMEYTANSWRFSPYGEEVLVQLMPWGESCEVRMRSTIHWKPHLTVKVSVRLSFLSPESSSSRRLSSSSPPSTWMIIMVRLTKKEWRDGHLKAFEIAHMGLFIFAKGETGDYCRSIQSGEVLCCTWLKYLVLGLGIR